MKTKSVKRQVRLAIASNAGGSGKTTMAVHLAYGLGVQGYKTTILELDRNGSLAILAGLPFASPEESMASVLGKEFNGIYPLTPVWEEYLSNVNVVRGGKPLEESVGELYLSNRKHYTLLDRLEDYPLDSDFIIIDTPASLDPMGLVALAAATHLIAPIKPEYKDTGALAELMVWYNEKVAELRLKPRPQFLGFVPSRVDLDEGIHRNLLGVTKKGDQNPKIDPVETLPYQIQQMGANCFPRIRESSYYLQACGAGLPLNVFRPGFKFYEDYTPIVNTLIKIATEE